MIRRPPRSPLFPYTPLSRSPAKPPIRLRGQKPVGPIRPPLHPDAEGVAQDSELGDRKSTRLNSSHSQISYAVFCLKKKKKKHYTHSDTIRRTRQCSDVQRAC